MQLEIDDIADVMAGLVHEATAPLIDANKALADRVAELEAREIVVPEPVIVPARPDMDAVKALVAEEVAAVVSALPPAEKGDPGEVDMDVVAGLVTKVVSALPPPEAGKDCDMGEVERMLAEHIDVAVAALPPPKDGVGLASAFKDHEGCLVLTMTDGSTRNLGRIDGENGKDGETFTLDDFDIVPYEDGRTIKLCFTRGEVMHSFELCFDVPLDRGVWKDGGAYAKGDGVTWAGSWWIAQRDAPGKPDTPDGGWRLAVKRGRDGKDAEVKRPT